MEEIAQCLCYAMQTYFIQVDNGMIFQLGNVSFSFRKSEEMFSLLVKVKVIVVIVCYFMQGCMAIWHAVHMAVQHGRIDGLRLRTQSVGFSRTGNVSSSFKWNDMKNNESGKQ